jgi:hypothetical protein
MMPMGDDFNTPPMDDGGFGDGMIGDGGMGEGNPNMPVMDDGTMPMGGGMQNPYDSNFDPGVEANEEEDPKRFIQQLAGKLSQSLLQYNKSLPQPDADLGKYVAGMVVKQAVEGLSQEDKTDVINKINSDEPVDNQQGGEMPQQEMPMGDGMQQPSMDNGMPQQPMESIYRGLNELDTRPGMSKKEEDLQPKKSKIKRGYKNSPFMPKF